MKVLPLLRFPFISLGTKKTLTGNLMKPALSYSSVAEDKKHVRLVTALKSHSLNLSRARVFPGNTRPEDCPLFEVRAGMPSQPNRFASETATRRT
jgi:hypothetical protein